MSQPDCASRDAVDQIEISSPCTVSWDEMRAAGGAGGDERVRFCGQCRQNVYNVEAMSRTEARRLIAAREGRVCVRILRRPDGTVVTADCWARLRVARRRGFLPVFLSLVGMMVLVGLTELIAIGVGLRRLQSLLVGRPPAPVVVAHPDVPRAATHRNWAMGLFGPRPPAPLPRRETGELVAPQRLLGKMKRN